MTTYAEVHGATLIQYPYGFAQLQAENEFTNYGGNSDFVLIFPKTDTAVKNGYTLEPVTVLAQPTFDPATQVCTQNVLPTLVGGIWALGWTVAPMPADQLAAQLKTKAQAALDKSDVTILRCIENRVVVPAEWATYRKALRALVASGTGTMPTQPAYPQGT